MRKVIALILLISLMLTACGGKEKEKKTSSSPKATTSEKNESGIPSQQDDLLNEDVVSEDENFDEDSFSLGLYGTVTLGAQTSTKKESPVSVFKDTQTGGYDSETAALRKSISETPDALNVTGKKYYISPDGDDFNDGTSPETAWESLDALLMNNYLIDKGDAVLFERGGVYRENSSIIAKNGVSYGAYGTGEKPCIYGSAIDYANSSLWESSNKKNIWKMEFPQKDTGLIVFNYGEFAGVRKSGLASMSKNGDFYHNTSDKMIYIYCDNGNPGTVYKNIEIGTNQPLFIIYGGYSGITVDNICFKYTGAHGITAYEKNYDIKVTNCVLAWMGGSILSGNTRYGNAVQFWDSCWDVEIKNNWIYQIYDTGLTFQYKGTSGDGGKYNNISFADNLIEYCSYSIEYFTDITSGYMKNIDINGNVMRFAGYGFGAQRPNTLNDSHICAWSLYYGANIENFKIRNNLFDCSTRQAVDWGSGSTPHLGVLVSGNTFYQKSYNNYPVMNYGTAGFTYATNQAELEAATASFDSSPRLVKWLG